MKAEDDPRVQLYENRIVWRLQEKYRELTNRSRSFGDGEREREGDDDESRTLTLKSKVNGFFFWLTALSVLA